MVWISIRRPVDRRTRSITEGLSLLKLKLYFSRSWKTTKWGACSKSCNSGVRTRNTYCTLGSLKEQYVLPDYDCKTDTKPHTSEECNEDMCHAEWLAEPFGPVSSLIF